MTDYLIKQNEKMLDLYSKGEEIPAWLFLDIANTIDIIKENELS